MILLVDNYDSFTWNLAHMIAVTGREVLVRRNDEVGPEEVAAIGPEGIVLSPGPGRPETAGSIVEIVRRHGPSVPILGICLGHQAIGVAYGAEVVRGAECVHGRASAVRHGGADLFGGVEDPFPAGRYHSLVIAPEGLPPCLAVTATAADGTIMGVRHATHPVRGLQFHPESVLTPAGPRIVANWLGTL